MVANIPGELDLVAKPYLTCCVNCIVAEYVQCSMCKQFVLDYCPVTEAS